MDQAPAPAPALQPGGRPAPETGSRSSPHVTDGTIDRGDKAYHAIVPPYPVGGRDKIGAERCEPCCVLGAVDVPGHARHYEDLRPPGDKLRLLIDPADIALGGRGPEGDVVGAELSETHGVVAALPTPRSDARAFAEEIARLPIGFVVGLDMEAVGTEALGKARVGLDETSHATPPDKIEQAAGMTFVGRGIVMAK